ncbi:MAG: hypothetical protein EP350_04885 [Alphaproteobacteria bacterium]|nr:MAG: hypothetical protein EP350_04885 [Alphaproteobacteria bacterium]
MNDVLPQDAAHQRARDWRKSASDHVAYALLVYTSLQIFVTVQAMKSATAESLSILPYLALIVLVAAIIPACRKFERRWALRPDEEAHDPALAGDFRRDIIMLWALAILLPLALTAVFKAIAAVL